MSRETRLTRLPTTSSPVTQRERTFPAEERLISTTDLNSKISYCNDAFVEISGFSEPWAYRSKRACIDA